MIVGNDADQTVISSSLLSPQSDETRNRKFANKKVLPESGAVSAPSTDYLINSRVARRDGSDDELLTKSAEIFFEVNPYVARAVPVFKYLHELMNGGTRDLNAAHARFLVLLRSYEANLIKDGSTEIRARILLYALCATVDDIVLQFKNSLGTIWTNKSMISLFFNETWGGERFFVFLSQMMKAGASHTKELEVYYLCLELGFEGRYRLDPNDREIRRVKDEVYQFLRTYWGGLPSDLSPSWRGERAPARRAKRDLRHWVALIFVVLAIATIFIILSNYLTQKRREAEFALNALKEFSPPPVTQQEARPVQQNPVPATPPPQREPDPKISDLSKSGLLTVDEKNGQIVINTTQEVFASASAVLRDAYIDVFEKLASKLNEIPGQITVLGNTDSVPIRSRLYADNMALSEARAQAVADLLGKFFSDGKNRIIVKGQGATQPVADNATPEGRLRNRRVEITVVKP